MTISSPCCFRNNEMTILDYNRVLRDLNGHSAEATARQVAASVTLSRQAISRCGHGARRIRHVSRRPLVPACAAPRRGRRRAVIADPIDRLPITLLSRNMIEPLFGITDPRTDKRIDFVGGGRGLGRAGTAGLVGRDGGGVRALSDPDERPDGGRRCGQDHAAEIDLVRAEARRRHGQPRFGLSEWRAAKWRTETKIPARYSRFALLIQAQRDEARLAVPLDTSSTATFCPGT